jgi:holo-[acyl-carrier protein] synthase
MAILGIGQDLIEIDRINMAIQSNGDRFLTKIFTKDEIAYCNGKKNSAESFAVRFAAKEAIAKAFQTGIGERLNWQDIEIAHNKTGAPCAIISPKFTAIYPKLKRVHLTLSHTKNYATAFVVLED